MKIETINDCEKALKELDNIVIENCENALKELDEIVEKQRKIADEATTAEDKAREFGKLAEMEAELKDTRAKVEEVKKNGGGKSFEEFVKENTDEDSEKNALAYKNDVVSVEKTASGKFRIIFGKSTLCVCDNPLNAICVCNAMTCLYRDFKAKAILGKLGIDKMIDAIKEL